MILATLERGRFTGQTSQTILRLCPSSVRPVTDLSPRARIGSLPAPRKIFPDFEAELGFSGIHCIMFSGSAFASAPLSTAEIFTIPFLLRQQLTPGSCRCHRPTVIREPCHTFRSTRVAWSIAVDFAIFGSPRSIQLHLMYH